MNNVYCLSCKTYVVLKDYTFTTFKDKRMAIKGKCPHCQRTILRLVSKKDGLLATDSFLNSLTRVLKRKKARNLVILDLRGLSFYLCDYFVICTAEATTHSQALVEKVLDFAKKGDVSLHHKEEDQEQRWILLDFGRVIVHIFQEDSRKFYDLEHLWSTARRINLE